MIDLIQHHHKTRTPIRKVLDHGHVALVDCMPRVIYLQDGMDVNQVHESRATLEGEIARVASADPAIMRSARISYITNRGKNPTAAEDRGLIRYLVRNNHTTPLEMVVFQFDIKLPIFVARQLIRHRMSSLNEVSARYSVLPSEFYVPTVDEIRSQSKTNKQGSDGQVDPEVAQRFVDWIHQTIACYGTYEKFCDDGVAREMARIGLPLNIYTHWSWKIDLKNLLHLLNLRCDSHAQFEIRVYADAMLDLIRPLLPYTIEAWEDFSPYRGGLLLTALEVESVVAEVANRQEEIKTYRNALREAGLDPDKVLVQGTSVLLPDRATKREREEWAAKKKRLGF